jgi:hypothetical protein
MNTSKLIDLGKVSGETKGHIGVMENPLEPTKGPPA